MHEERIKRPAYQWYVADAENDEIFLLMTYEQQGIYRRLLDRQWIEGSIPADPALVFQLLPKLKSYARFQRLWPLISTKFQPKADGRLINAKLESQWRELDLYITEQRKRGQLGGRRKADRLALARLWLEPTLQPNPSSSSSSSSSSATKNQEISTAASAVPIEPIALGFPTIGVHGGSWALTDRQVSEWSALFPGLDILAEARHALAWLQADPGRRKTSKGMSKFLVGWFTRSVNSGHARTGSKPAAGRHSQWAGKNPGAEIRDV